MKLLGAGWCHYLLLVWLVLGRWRNRLKGMDWECVEELMREDEGCLSFLC